MVMCHLSDQNALLSACCVSLRCFSSGSNLWSVQTVAQFTLPADLAIASEQQPFLGFSVDIPPCQELCLALCSYTINLQC